jgi:HK97 family phage portal protein
MIPVAQFMSSRISTQKADNRPMFTSLASTASVLHPSRIIETSYKEFWRKFKNSPELVATISIPITDMLGDRPEWTKPDGSALGKTELRRATQFWRNQRGKEILRAMLFDAFVTGDGYLWKGKVTKKEITAALKEVLLKYQGEFSSLQIKELESKIAEDEDIKNKKQLDYVASSTMSILYDEYDIYGYEQNIMDNMSKFSTDEIIHFRYLALDGKVYGFSPVEALAAEIFLLTTVKQNMISFMENGGAPDKVFTLPKELAGSKNHEFLIEQLRKYKRIQNRHGNLVFTGEMKIEDLQGSPKDLEYKDLALYTTSNIAFAFGIPISRIPFLIGSSATGGDSGGLSESGYWNRISDLQDSLEDLLNSQLFEELGWAIKFNRKYKADEVKEAQINSMNADTLTKIQSILQSQGKQLTMNKIREYLMLKEEDLEESTMELQVENNTMGQNQLSNSEVLNEDDKKRKANTKRNVANSKGTREALWNP